MFLIGVAGLAGRARGRPRLNVYNWSNYVAPDTIANFEAEFGVRVRYATYESNEELLAKVMGGNSGWDVVFPSHNRIPPMRQYGLLARLDHARLPNLPHLEPRFRSGQGDGRQFRLGRGLSLAQSHPAHAPVRAAGAARSRAAAQSAEPGAALPKPAVGSTLGILRPVYVGRHGH